MFNQQKPIPDTATSRDVSLSLYVGRIQDDADTRVTEC